MDFKTFDLGTAFGKVHYAVSSIHNNIMLKLRPDETPRLNS